MTYNKSEVLQLTGRFYISFRGLRFLTHYMTTNNIFPPSYPQTPLAFQKHALQMPDPHPQHSETSAVRHSIPAGARHCCHLASTAATTPSTVDVVLAGMHLQPTSDPRRVRSRGRARQWLNKPTTRDSPGFPSKMVPPSKRLARLTSLQHYSNR